MAIFDTCFESSYFLEGEFLRVVGNVCFYEGFPRVMLLQAIMLIL